MKLLKLGVPVVDSATGLKGMLTHVQIDASWQKHYLFQPKGINPEDGLPVKGIWLNEQRVSGGEFVEVDLPTKLFNSEATDKASGYTGIVTNLTYHINGCVHAQIQPKGVLKKTGAAIEPYDFDVRRLEGKMVPKMTETEKIKDQVKKPSPAPVRAFVPRL